MNRGRPRHNDILTPREWQVLELIEAGHTNEEIAARLDISFGTAKYHVAEIISKLGVTSREQAPEAARSGRVAAPAVAPLAWLRSRFVMPAVAIVAVAGLLLVSIATFTDLLRDDGASPSDQELASAAVDFDDADLLAGISGVYASVESLSSYYFEVRIEADEDDVLGTVRAWYESPDRWRFEFGDFAAGIPGDGSVQISDGQTIWFYEAGTNTYNRNDIEAYFSGRPPEMRDTPIFLPASLFIGPLPTHDPESFLRGLTPDWKLEEISDGASIAGRPTHLYRYTITGSGELRLWLDREHPFVLRFETGNSGSQEGNILAEVIDLALNQPIDAARFAFEPPVGSLEVDAPGDTISRSSGSASSGMMGSDNFGAPEGFLTPSYLPDGFSITREQSGSSSVNGNRLVEHAVTLKADDGDAFLEVAQQYRAGGLSPSQAQGEPVQLGSTTGYQRTENGEQLLVWAEGDIVITLHTDTLPFAELVRVAESMQGEP